MPSGKRGLRVAVGTAAVVAGLGLVGTLLAPSWSPPPALERPFPDSSQQATPPSSPLLPATGTPILGAVPELPIERAETTLALPGTTVAATVVAPAVRGRYPGVVLVPGAGPQTRSGLSEVADAFARAGVVALSYDKRTVGYSPVSRDYGLLASDALAGVRLLSQRADVAPGRVGIWAISEGAWVAPIAATHAPSEVAFLVLVSPPNTSPLLQTSWAADTALRELDAPLGVRKLMVLGQGMGERFIPYITHDPLPILQRVGQPVLAIYGAQDDSVPTAQSAQNLIGALSSGGNTARTIRFFTGADHGLRTSGGAFADGYLPTVLTWVRGLPGTAQPPIGAELAGASSSQRYATPELPAAPWYATGPGRILAVGLIVLGGLAGPVVALFARRRTATAPQAEPAAAAWQPLRRRLRRLALSGVLTHLAPVVLVAAIAAVLLSGNASSLLVGGMWLLTQLIALTTVVLAVETTDRTAGALRQGWRPDGPQRVWLAGTGLATAVVFLFISYSGVFTLLMW